MMGSRRMEITIVSAEDLPDIRLLGWMKVYTVVSVNGSIRATNVDREGGTNPRWNSSFVYAIDEWDLRCRGLDVVVELFCERTLGDKFIGEVRIPVKNLFEMGLKSHIILCYSVSSTCCGRLLILYYFEDKCPKRSEANGGGGGRDGDAL
ncbi:hypothetical protein C2S53_014357 [Perilla frutescens var. hirtella]|uniref:C2 domain-containing protein n=1 Tax=Perilla frutescens var. hirtella TaxID=608512 RepID=A0AAD4JFE9_PERFH|nr:hypothetical protein C2S53_014357 [Perilla frutescens var. hirtella]